MYSLDFFLINSISTFVGYVVPDPSLQMNRFGTIKFIVLRKNRLYTFSNVISPKVNVIV